MNHRLRHIARAAFWITIFSVAGFAFVTLALWLACMIGGHYTLENIFGLTTPVLLGVVIGIEGFLWLQERRT